MTLKMSEIIYKLATAIGPTKINDELKLDTDNSKDDSTDDGRRSFQTLSTSIEGKNEQDLVGMRAYKIENKTEQNKFLTS